MSKQRRKKMTEKRFETRLARLLARTIGEKGCEVRTYKEAEILTSSRGLVVELPNHQEFQITIVESTRW